MSRDTLSDSSSVNVRNSSALSIFLGFSVLSDPFSETFGKQRLIYVPDEDFTSSRPTLMKSRPLECLKLLLSLILGLSKGHRFFSN